jgi:predicted ArsR family transcriptional regulator
VDPSPDPDQQIAALAALDQPMRRDLFQVLCHRDGWTSRDDASRALGISRALAAFHLDKLAEAGVVDTIFERVSGRSGPGAGRPSKLYRPTTREVSASVPARRYELAGSLLAAAVEATATSGRPIADALDDVSGQAGRDIGAAAANRAVAGQESELVAAVLRDHGYDPGPPVDGEIVLSNCPFHHLAEQHRDVICAMNLHLITGVLIGLGDSGRALTAHLQPDPEHCCVRLTAS